MIEKLNQEFAIDGQLRFVEGPGGFIFAEIDNTYAKASIALHGAHVTSFIPKGEKPVIWTSPSAIYKKGKAIRGGIPVCWPWFSAHPDDSTKPSHGFVRNRNWEVVKTEAVVASLTDSSREPYTRVVFQLTDTEEMRTLWPHAFKVQLAVCVGSKLTVSLTTTNTDNSSFMVGGVLHSYFSIADISETIITGLEATSFIDSLDGMKKKQEATPIEFTREVDRVYVNTTEPTLIHDCSNSRIIRVEKSGSDSTVVWNPWKEIATNMADMNDDGYKEMVCVETTNALEDLYSLNPGESHTLRAIISSEDVR